MFVMKLINGRYKIGEQVEKDRFSTSYIAIDRFKNNQKKLLTLFEPELSYGKLIDYYKNEYIFLNSLEHDYILKDESFDVVNTIDNRETKNIQFFYTREYFYGDHIKYFSLNENDSIQVFYKICCALRYLHFRGVCYIHLNLDNIAIFKDGDNISVKLKDIAYIKQMDYERSKIDHHNHQFLSPEYQMGIELSFRSDIYSLGVVLFYLINKLDYRNERFIAENNKELTYNKKIYNIIKKMTAFESSERYKSVKEIIDELEKTFGGSLNRLNEINIYERIYFKTKLVNREREMDHAANLVESLRNTYSRTMCLIIEGEEGIGKSRLVKEILYKSKWDKIDTYFSSFDHADEIEYKTFRWIVKQMFKNAHHDLIEKYGPELVKIIPEISQVWDVKPSPVLMGDKEKLRLYDRIFHFIGDYINNRPAIIIIENIHYADINTIEMVDYFLKSEKKLPVLFILSLNSDKNSIFNNFSKKWTSFKCCSYIQLMKFNLEETATHIQNILGMAWKPLELATRIMKTTEGNPRYIEEVIKDLYAEKYIAINKDWIWVAKDVDNIYDFKLPSNIGEAILGQIKSYEKVNLEVLKVISTFNSSVSAEVIGKILSIDSEKLQKVLSELVMIKCLNQKLEDWGYTYDFYNTQLKLHIYNSIDTTEKKAYHMAASNILEEYYIKEGRENKDELINHFTKCGKLSKAIDYCLEAAEKMMELTIYTQALNFYGKAVELLKLHRDDRRKIDVLLIMGRIFFQIGENDKAIDVYKQIKILGASTNYEVAVADSQNRLAEIFIFKNMLHEAYEEIASSKALSLRISYDYGYLDSMLTLSKIMLKKSELTLFRDMMKEGLDKSLSSNYFDLAGHFLNQRGKYYRYTENYEKAMLDFIESINYFKKASKTMESINPINNIGEVLAEGLQDYKLSRTYYIRALRIAEKYNLVTGMNAYFLNIGKTYLIEEQYDKAYEYFTRAVQVSEETDDKSVLLSTYVFMCDLFLEKGEYLKAYSFLKKAEMENIKSLQNRKDSLEYCLELIKYYMMVGANSLALAEIEKIKMNYRKMYKLHEFTFNTYKILLRQDLKAEELVDCSMILLEKNDEEPFAKEKRTFALRLAFLLINDGYLKEAKNLLDYDHSLSMRFNSSSLELKRKYLLGYYENNKIEYFERLLRREENNFKCLEYEWKIQLVLGDHYFTKNEYYKAVNSYIYALDILKRLVLKIPSEFQLDYLNNDPNKLSIKRKIETVRSIILEEPIQQHTEKNTRITMDNLEHYFDFSDFQMLFQNEKFLETALKEYNGFFTSKVSSIRELILQLSADDIQNMQCVLKYCIKISLANKGFIILVDKKYQIQQVIKINENHEMLDIGMLIEKVTQQKMGILIKNKYDMKHVSTYELLPGTSQAAICIPIIQTVKGDTDQIIESRKNWSYERQEKILGYLYLETDKVFNNFDWSTFKTCEALTNLLNVLIDNYRLKIASSLDSLTNVLVRKYIEKELKNEVEKAENSLYCFSIIMADIDKFKLVNDLFGHQQGDHVLKKVGKIMKDSLRNSDKIGRYGGEEFIILLPNTGKGEAYIVSEKIRNSIENAKLLGDEVSVTMSFGISTFPEHGTKEDELIEKADQTLYYAKESGRNQTKIWNKDIGFTKKRVDKLAGIISGNLAMDHRTVQVIVEMMELVKNNDNKKEKLFEILGRLVEITEAKNGVIIELVEGLTKTYARERFKDSWTDNYHIDYCTVERVKKSRTGEVYIDWENIHTLDTFTGTPDWQSRIVLPIIYLGKMKGIIQLSVPTKEKEFDFNTFNFVNSLTGIIGSVI